MLYSFRHAFRLISNLNTKQLEQLELSVRIRKEKKKANGQNKIVRANFYPFLLFVD